MIVRVLVVDDHSLLSEIIGSALTAEHGFAVDIAATGAEGLAKIKENGPYNAVLLDYDLPGSNGLDVLRSFVKMNSGGVALFSGVAGYPVIKHAMELGASGYIPKTTRLQNLANVIRLIAGGEIYLPLEYVQKIGTINTPSYGLKPREILVLNLLGEGLQNKEIGQSLELEETVTKMTVRAICQKLGVKNRTQAVIFAKDNGLI